MPMQEDLHHCMMPIQDAYRRVYSMSRLSARVSAFSCGIEHEHTRAIYIREHLCMHVRARAVVEYP